MNKQASIVEGRIEGEKVYTVKWRWVESDTWYYLPTRYTTRSIDRALQIARLVEKRNSK